MEVKISSKEDFSLIEIIRKENESTSTRSLESILKSLAPCCRMIFDMNKCEFLSSAELRVLLGISQQIQEIGGRGAFVGLRKEVASLMYVTGFDNIFKNFDTLSEALAAVKGGNDNA
ncbi:MAG: STAS domain-containing protein [Clostridia bacterium]|nr:STAS domain-containing protein [Clostridia bacterium]